MVVDGGEKQKTAAEKSENTPEMNKLDDLAMKNKDLVVIDETKFSSAGGEGRYTARIDNFARNYQSKEQSIDDRYDTKHTIFEFKKGPGNKWVGTTEGNMAGDAMTVLDVINTDLIKMRTTSDLWPNPEDITDIKVTGAVNHVVGSSQIFLVVETKDGRTEKRNINSLQEPLPNGKACYLTRYSGFKEDGEMDITAAFNNDVNKKFDFESNSDKTMFFKYNPNNVNQRVEEKPYQFYTEVALKDGYTTSFDAVAANLKISMQGNTPIDENGNNIYFWSNGDKYQIRQNGEGVKGAVDISREQYYVCQATLYRMAEKLPPYTGTTKDLEGGYKFTPLYKNT